MGPLPLFTHILVILGDSQLASVYMACALIKRKWEQVLFSPSSSYLFEFTSLSHCPYDSESNLTTSDFYHKWETQRATEEREEAWPASDPGHKVPGPREHPSKVYCWLPLCALLHFLWIFLQGRHHYHGV